jgi:hypothetical protein
MASDRKGVDRGQDRVKKSDSITGLIGLSLALFGKSFF